jgi:antitoxin VapB
MAPHITNPVVVGKVERLAEATGLSKTAVVEWALDLLMGETMVATSSDRRVAALLAQLERIPERTNAFDPKQWDERGLPE